MYDVIVTGAGPAGCTAAKTLAEKGLCVLLAERCKLPRKKSCSGQLIKKTLELTERYFGEAVPESALCTPRESLGMVFCDDKGREYRFEQEGLNIWRSSFDFFLAKKAEEEGAFLLEETAVTSFSDDGGKVTVSFGKKTETAKWLIGCDGAGSVTRYSLAGARPPYINTFQTFNKGSADLDPRYFYAYLQPEFSGYDAWFNVKDGMAVIGVSAEDKSKIPQYYARFKEYMIKEHGLSVEEQVTEESWIMPRIDRGCPVLYGKGRVLLAGEAAGFLNPMGEGISAAMESGYLAACAIAENFDDPFAAIETYRGLTKELHGYMQRQWGLVGRLAGTFEHMAGCP